MSPFTSPPGWPFVPCRRVDDRCGSHDQPWPIDDPFNRPGLACAYGAGYRDGHATAADITARIGNALSGREGSHLEVVIRSLTPRPTHAPSADVTAAPPAPGDGWLRCPRCTFATRQASALTEHLDAHTRAAADQALTDALAAADPGEGDPAPDAAAADPGEGDPAPDAAAADPGDDEDRYEPRPVCTECWYHLNPGRTPYRLAAEHRTRETCAACGTPTGGGIYVRARSADLTRPETTA